MNSILKHDFFKNLWIPTLFIFGIILGFLFWTSFFIPFLGGIYFRISMFVLWIVYFIIVGFLNNFLKIDLFYQNLFCYVAGNIFGSLFFFILAVFFVLGTSINWLITQFF